MEGWKVGTLCGQALSRGRLGPAASLAAVAGAARHSSSPQAFLYLASAKTYQKGVKDRKKQHCGEYARSFFNCWSSPKPESWKYPNPRFPALQGRYGQLSTAAGAATRQRTCAQVRAEIRALISVAKHNHLIKRAAVQTPALLLVWKSTDLVEAEVFKGRQG